MAPMNMLVAGHGVAVGNVNDGVWSVREVYERVEFFIDDTGLGELITARGLGLVEDQVSPFDVSPEQARAALVGDAAFEDWLDDAVQVPLLLMCPCGDLQCGALTVRLSRSDDAVQWTDWAWEDFHAYTESVALPTMTFALGEYLGAVEDAAQLGAGGLTLLTRVKVRRPGPWWRNVRRLPEARTDQRTMLGWLEAQAVNPNKAEADGDYFEFLSALDHAQSLIAGVGEQVGKLSAAHRADAWRGLDGVMASRHRRSLPADTFRAAQWFLARLSE